MSINNIARGIRQSGVRLGPLDAAFAGYDFYDGKQQGEDNVRAAAGAAGSTLGGWGGATAGGLAGAAIGSVVPVIGTAIGGAVGAIAGGMIGGTAGGWGADRVDEAVRGNAGINSQKQLENKFGRPLTDAEKNLSSIMEQQKQNKDKNMTTFNQQTGQLQDDYGNLIYDDYGNPVTTNNYKEDTYGWGDAAVTAAGLGATAYGVQPIAKNLLANGMNPRNTYGFARQLGATNNQAVRGAAAQGVDDLFRATRNLPGAAKVAGAVGGAILGNQAFGNPLGKAIDSLTGQRTNFDNDPVNRARAVQNKAVEAQQQAQQAQQNQIDNQQDQRMQRSQGITNNFAGRKMPGAFNNNPYDEMMRQMSNQYEQKALDRQDYVYERNFNDSNYVAERSKQAQREDYLTATRADQAKSLVDAYVTAIPNSVANQMRTVFGSRY